MRRLLFSLLGFFSLVSVLFAAAPHPLALTKPASQLPPPTLAGKPTLRMLVPAGHASSWLAELAQKAAAVQIEAVTYDSEIDFHRLFEAPGAAYDLIAINDRVAEVMVGSGQLRPLPAFLGELPLASQPSPVFLHHYFDHGNRFVWPYAWTLLAIATPNPAIRGWHDLLNPALSLTMPNDRGLRDALWAMAGGTGRLASPAWQAASAGMPATVTPQTVWVDTVSRLHPLLLKKDEKWNVVLPAEGSLITLYHWAIPNTGSQPVLAEAVLRALVLPAVSARIAAENNLGVTQPDARRMVPPALLADPLVFPSDRVMNQCRFVRPDEHP